MATVRSTTFVRSNDGTPNNQHADPTTAPVFVEIYRGFNTVIPNFTVAVCSRDATGQLHVLPPKPEPNGQFPNPANPAAPAPRYDLGSANQLPGKCVVVLANGATPSTTPGSIAIIVRYLQQNAAGVFRIVSEESDTSQGSLQQSRFEKDFVS